MCRGSSRHAHPTGERTKAARKHGGVRTLYMNIVEPDRKTIGDNLRDDRVQSLSLAGRARGHHDTAIGMDSDRHTLEWSEPCIFDVTGNTNPKQPTLISCPGLILEQPRQIGEPNGVVKSCDVVATVILHWPPVARRQHSGFVRKTVWGDEVPAPDFQSIDTDLTRRPVKQT